MSLLKALFVAWLWAIVIAAGVAKGGMSISVDTQVISLAIVVAGALAGGDK